ncbi:MAG: VOC family protein, partial [Chloroflexota bacterium]
ARVSLTAVVPDVDDAVRRAVDEGATLERLPADNPYGRDAVIRDPFGHRWILSGLPSPLTNRIRQGDIGYVSLWVPDVERAADFFSSVLGWAYTAGGAPQGRHVSGFSLGHGLRQGLWGGQERGTLFLCYAVDDVAAAVDRVRVAGGSAEEPRSGPDGLIANCVDDQGMPFAVYQPAGDGEQRPPMNGTGQGDLAYVTMEVVDSAAARAFYSAVLGWRFTPGRVEDGWTVLDAAPMTGMSGGHPQPAGVPMYRVDDIHAAVERVRAAGGTATDPEQQPYGLSSQCADDQGTHFYLGQI